jgi:multidrug efflux pump subunit AcrA (membrane-fusion protein)
VEWATFALQTAEVDRDLTLKVNLPRRDQTLNENVQKQEVALERTRTTLPLTLSQKRQALAKLRYERQKAADKLAQLQKDREAMTLKAPADGVVYHGKSFRGQWTTAAVTPKLQRGGTLTPHEVILTVVKPRPVFVLAAVEEKDLHHVHPGSEGKVVTVPYPDLKLPAKVEKVSAIPVTPGNFEARCAIDVGKDAEALMPGMACTVKLVPYKKEDALTLPAAVVFTEELDEDKAYVYLPGKDGKPEKRPVVVGKKSESKVEILKGLKEGDEVLLEKPAPAKKADPQPKKG